MRFISSGLNSKPLQELPLRGHYSEGAFTGTVVQELGVGAKTYMRLVAAEEVANICCLRSSDDAGLLIGLDRRGAGYLMMTDRSGAARLTARLRSDGSPFLSMSDSQGKQQIMLGIRADGSPVLNLFDTDENPRLSVGLGADGKPSALFMDEAGKTVFSLP